MFVSFSNRAMGRASRLAGSSARRCTFQIAAGRAELKYRKVRRSRGDFSNAFVTKRQTDRLRREAFGVRRIPALCESFARREAKAPEYGALQTLRAIWLRLGRAEDPARRDALPTVSDRLR